MSDESDDVGIADWVANRFKKLGVPMQESVEVSSNESIQTEYEALAAAYKALLMADTSVCEEICYLQLKQREIADSLARIRELMAQIQRRKP